jgi:ribosomal protein S18 acetylase RimI-like enzyme
VIIRPATEADLDTVSTLTVAAYAGDGLMQPDAPYLEHLGDAKSRFVDGGLLVADQAGAVIGAVSFVLPGSPYAELCIDGEAEFRMLAVSPAARGRGLGEVLVQECIASAYRHDCDVLRLATQAGRLAARHVYDRLGFQRTPDRDWSPEPNVELIAYALNLRAYDDGRTELEPPRYCGACGRRMVVQVTPRGWTARCSTHGQRTG